MRYATYIYKDLKKEYYLKMASRCLYKAGLHLGTSEYNAWMNKYHKYVDKFNSIRGELEA